MSEKRFTVDDDGIYDNHEKKHFKFVAYDWIDCDIHECCEKLNEQQDIIFKLQDLCGQSDRENARLRIENKQLRKELNGCEKFRYQVFKRMGELNDDGRFQVWEVPPIPKGTRITFSTTTTERND